MMELTFKTTTGTYRIRRRWWRGWSIDKWDRVGAQIVARGWFPLTDDEAVELCYQLRFMEPDPAGKEGE